MGRPTETVGDMPAGYRHLNKSQSAPTPVRHRKGWLAEKFGTFLRFISSMDSSARDRAVEEHEQLSPTAQAVSRQAVRDLQMQRQGYRETPVQELQSSNPQQGSQQQQAPMQPSGTAPQPVLGRLATLSKTLRSMFSRDSRDQQEPRRSPEQRQQHQSPIVTGPRPRVIMAQQQQQQQQQADGSDGPPQQATGREGAGGGIMTVSRNVALLRVPTLAARQRGSNVIAVCEDLPPGEEMPGALSLSTGFPPSFH